MPHFPSIGGFSEHPHSADDNSSCSLEQIITTQAQHTTILRQIQHNLDIRSAPEHVIPSPPEPSQAPPFVDQPMPPEEPPTGEAEAAEPSSPHHPPATI